LGSKILEFTNTLYTNDIWETTLGLFGKGVKYYETFEKGVFVVVN
jgi:hypothetical protein